MKKFFVCLFLGIAFFVSQTASAGVRSAAEPPEQRSTDVQKNNRDLQKLYKEIPDLNDKQAVQEYLKKRLKIARHADVNPEEVNIPNSFSIIKDVDDVQQKNTLSAYEKIYQQALKRAESNQPLNANDRISGKFYELSQPKIIDEPLVPDFPYVMVKLSDEREIMAPAEEHIAYMLTTAKIESTGLVNMTEEFVYVSNNEGFPEGFFRILPKYSYSRSGKKRRYDISLQSVTINGEEYPYKITEIGNYLYIEPKKPLNLPTGIYTYRFNYIIDRAIWYYNEFDEFYWDITARTLKNVVGSANAVIILPAGSEFLAQNAIISTKDGLNPSRMTITSLAQNSLAFADTEAMAPGDDAHLFITLEKQTLLKPDMMRQYLWFVQDYGDILFALLTLLAIFISYKISLSQIYRNKDKTRATIRKTPAIFRLINSNVFDMRSLLSEILELKARNIVDLNKEEDTVALIKKTDDIKKLPKSMQKLVQLLFPGAETILPANNTSKLKLERAYKYLQKNIKHEYRKYILKLNGTYLACSLGMLLCGIIATSTIAINSQHTFWVITICMILMFICMIAFDIRPKNKIINIVSKLFIFLIILGIAGALAIYTSAVYSALMIIIIYLILYYYKAFSRRSGLLRNKIKETEEYKSYLQKNPELTTTARDFNARIPYIYAFALENKYPEVDIFKNIACYEKINPLLK